jgi:hypothetical protein
MRYCLLRRGSEFVIYRVKDEEVLEFLEKYQPDILLEAASLMQLLLLFEQDYLFSVDYHN